jgi:hypothetical protein
LLNLNVQITNFLGMKSYVMETPLPDGSIAKYEQELPQIETTSMQTRVSIPEGETLLLAGQKIETTSVQTRVSIPDGGTLLLGGQKVRSKGDQDEQVVEKELLIFINAKIVEVDPNDAGRMHFPGMGYGGYGGVYGPGDYGRGYGPYISRYGGGYGPYGGGYGGYGAHYRGRYGGMYGTGPYGGWYGTYGEHRFAVPYGGIDPCKPYGGGYGAGPYGGRYGGYGGGYGGHGAYGDRYGGSIEAYRKHLAAPVVKSGEPNTHDANSGERR